jgi:hypothetical protein
MLLRIHRTSACKRRRITHRKPQHANLNGRLPRPSGASLLQR